MPLQASQQVPSAAGRSRVALNCLNQYLIMAIWAGNIMGTDGKSLTTELDSHANMVVAGKHATIVARTGRHAEVQAFSNECNALQRYQLLMLQ